MSSKFNNFLAAAHRDDLRRTAARSRAAERHLAKLRQEDKVMKKIRGKLTYANVVSSLCLFLVLGGGAALAATHLKRNSVGTAQIKDGAVTAAKVESDSLTGAQIAESTLGTVPSAVAAQTAQRAEGATRADLATRADTAARADLAGDATTLQGNPPSAFMRGAGRFFSNSVDLSVGQSGVPVFELPGLGPVTAKCRSGATKTMGELELANTSGQPIVSVLQFPRGGTDAGTIAAGGTGGVGGEEALGAWTWQLARQGPVPVIATVEASFASSALVNSAGCLMIAQATVSP